jgi:tRNA-(ms[2]io[6]A)-hydroxylase
VERFGLVADHLEDPELSRFYRRLSLSEAGHAETFVRLAAAFFSDDEIAQRLEHWQALEAEAMAAVPIRAALH